MAELSGYLGLVLAALGSATLLPLQSEAVLVGLLLADAHSVWVLLTVATVGNVLGAVVNWSIGRGLEQYRHRRWLPVSEYRLAQAQGFYRRTGHWSLLLSWVPVVGDPLTLIAGLLREPLWRFLGLVTLAKGGRYLVLSGLVLGWL
ncbi:YqaA family protein [Thiocapsa sp.]|uniref:YqaA family protein n=1 Tax=Thiocapsa sp. TaxID=2024551 RepID=UPI003593FB10